MKLAAKFNRPIITLIDTEKKMPLVIRHEPEFVYGIRARL
jgi:acetyl-CoA carboxylase alpha subunit